MRFFTIMHGVRKSLAQTTVEYAIIIALIAIAAIGAYMALGTQTTNLVKAETEKLATGQQVTVDQADTSGVTGPSLSQF
jgi:Flp pilus assembly pilin Flp